MSHQPSHAPGHGQPVDIYPAGAVDAHGHHGHVIIPARTLLLILGMLMFFTLATVGAAKAEQFIAHAFDFVIPQWVNVAVALSIATIKSVVVAMYFMQLRYDNPMNSAIAVFTLFVLAFFLGFTMIDLGGRNALYAYKAEYIIHGGTGGGGLNRIDSETGTTLNIDEPITALARKRAMAEIDELKKNKTPMDQWPKRLRKYADHLAHDNHAHGGHGDHRGSSPNRSRPRAGITLPELGGGTHADHAHEAAKPGDAKPAEKPAAGH